jgi:cellulose synthase/poly-beta-1,6-N-acetylglucosamine synthase-like glycosyltransferase
MNIMLTLLALIFDALGIYLVLNVLYLLFFAIAGHRKLAPLSAPPVTATSQRICVLMPAYKADAVILQTAPMAKRHAYTGVAQVHVIADQLQPATSQTLRQQGIGVIEVFFEKSTKGKALLAALESLPSNSYDVAVILDVDNVMEEGFLTQVNQAFAAGLRVVQGHRTSRNLDGGFAVLDACNEEINNHIFRRGHAALGMSPSLIGSGMAFEYGYLRQLLQDIGDTPGEDKELDFRLLKERVHIGYLSEAHVYDEKIPDAQVFQTQRTRWLATQVEFLKKYFWEGLAQLGKGNLEFFDKILQSMLLPRVLLLGLLSLLVAMAMLGLIPGSSPLFWVGLLAGAGLALLLSLPRRLYNGQVARAVLLMPVALGAMVLALLQINKAKKSFLHTPHRTKGETPHS